ncbi:MAG: ABC transporter substrate-binding protein [Rhodospirillales bacterium]|nr:ABC transporter substrate-binding protein [Rhodospirillales bacterium]
MRIQRLFARAMVVLLIVGITQQAVFADDAMAGKAEAFIVKLADEAISKLTDKSIGIEEQEKRFREIVREHIAFNTIARWVLGGHYWRAATEAQQNRYLGLFEDLMVATYAHRFQNYDGEKMTVASTRVVEDGQALVQTTLQRPGADKPLRVDWRVRETDGKLRVIDIMVEGLSMAQTQRSEFSAVLRDNGGNIDGLLDTLDGRLNSARGELAKSVKEAAKKS